MKRQRSFLRAAALAGALPCAAFAQDYRYPGGDDAARQTAPQPVQVQPAPVQQQVPPAAIAPAPPPCATCGSVDSIRITEKAGEGSAVGMLAGGLLGGLLGHQIGQGRGNTAATIVGAAGGAYAGHQVEKSAKRTLHYDVTVRMDDGTLRPIGYDFEPGFRTGDKVRFIDGRLTRI